MFPSFFHYATRRSEPSIRSSQRLRNASAQVPVTIRLAEAREPAVDRLRALDGGSVLDGPRLVAELDGKPVAALELRTGAAVADPFVLTAPLVELLRVRAAQLGVLR
jgi:hypothetical protein